MSYFNKLQQYRNRLEGRRQYIVPQPLNNLPPDQSVNLYHDKVRLLQDQIAQDATAPFTALGGGDLLRRGIQKIPGVKELQDAYSKSQEMRDKLNDFLDNDQLKSFLEDPEGTIKGLGQDAKDALTKIVNDGIAHATSQIPSTSDVISHLTGLGPAPADPEFDAQLKASLEDNPTNQLTASDDPEFDAQLKASLEEDAQKLSGTPVDTIADDDEDEFLDAKNPATLGDPHAGYLDDPDLPDDLREAHSMYSSLIQQNNKIGEDIDSLGVDRIDPQAGTLPPTRELPDELASKLSDIESQQRTAEGLTADAKDILSKGGGAEDALKDVLPETGEEEAGEAVGLGVGDAIPVLGTALDLGTIGAIIGEAVKSYADKKKEAKDAEAQQQRAEAIQQDIATEQSELVGQARDQAQQQVSQQQTQQQAQQPIKVGQVGSDIQS